MALLPSQLCWRCWDWNSRRQFQHQPGSKPASSPSSPQPPPPHGHHSVISLYTHRFMYTTHKCVFCICVVVLEPFDILHSFSFLFIGTVPVLPWKHRMFPFSYYLTLMLLCIFLFYKIKFQLFSHHCKPQLFLLFMQNSLLLSCSLFLK